MTHATLRTARTSSPHPLLPSADIRAIETQALAQTPPGTLMARAAEQVAQACAGLLRGLPPRTSVLALVGPGNNGGDALLAALALANRGWAVQAVALSAQAPAADDALRAWQRWHGQGLELRTPADLETLLADRPLVIDGLFGIGLSRPLPEAAADIARRLADIALTVVSVDVPSGIDADTGAVLGPPESVAVRAHLTVTLIADKPGLHTGAGLVHAGQVQVANLGLAAPCPASAGQLNTRAAMRPLVSVRARDAHKGCYGDVLVVQGDDTMRGAARLALLGAQAVGAGRLFLGVDRACSAPVDLPAELMTRSLDAGLPDPLAALGPADVIVIGCGLGRDDRARHTLEAALKHPASMVLDADGLNLVSGDQALQQTLQGRAALGRITVVTPHPLEAARLLGLSTAEVQRDRLAAARELANQCSAQVILKGAGSIMAAPDASWSINDSGGPILSVAGTGDVLAGTVGGLLAQGLSGESAASLAAWLHGAAADWLASQARWAGGIGLPASALPAAIRETLNRLTVDPS